MPYFVIIIGAMDALIIANDLKNGNNNLKKTTAKLLIDRLLPSPQRPQTLQPNNTSHSYPIRCNSVKISHLVSWSVPSVILPSAYHNRNHTDDNVDNMKDLRSHKPRNSCGHVSWPSLRHSNLESPDNDTDDLHSGIRQ